MFNVHTVGMLKPLLVNWTIDRETHLDGWLVQ